MNASLDQLRQAAIASSLRQSHLFSDCPTAALQQIASLSTVRMLEPGERLFHESKPAPGVFIVQRGAVKLHRNITPEREHIIHIFRPFESLAEESVVSDAGCPASATAIESSQVFVVEKAGFMSLLRRHPELTLSLFRALNRQLDLLMGRLGELGLKSVQTRVADWLIGHCPNPESDEPQTIRVPETKRILAQELGTCSETLSRTLAKLRDRQLLSLKGKTLTVLCPARLKRWLRQTGQRTQTGGVRCQATRLNPHQRTAWEAIAA